MVGGGGDGKRWEETQREKEDNEEVRERRCGWRLNEGKKEREELLVELKRRRRKGRRDGK